MKNNLQSSQSATRFFLHIVRAAAGLTLAAVLLPAIAIAEEQGSCSDATLRGRYGNIISGTRLSPTGSGVENFVGISLRNFDGDGGFVEEAATFTGASSGSFTVPIPTTGGTYHVNADCTGTSTLPVPGGEIDSVFVIVDNGKEVREIVVSPAPNVVIANYKRLH